MNQLPVEVLRQILVYLKNPLEWTLSNRAYYRLLYDPTTIVAWLRNQKQGLLGWRNIPLVPVLFKPDVLEMFFSCFKNTIPPQDVFRASLKMERFDALRYLLETYTILVSEAIQVAFLAIDKSLLHELEWIIGFGLGVSPPLLLRAASNGNLEALILLSLHHPLHFDSEIVMRKACYHGHIEIVQFCLDNGANVDACHGQALVYACKNGYLEIVKLLLKRKADVNVDSGKPMLKTIQRGDVEILKLLLKFGADPQQGVESAIKGGHPEILKLLIEYGAVCSRNDHAKIRLLPQSTRQRFEGVLK